MGCSVHGLYSVNTTYCVRGTVAAVYLYLHTPYISFDRVGGTWQGCTLQELFTPLQNANRRSRLKVRGNDAPHPLVVDVAK
jgi:hypothetical protein